MKHKHNIPFRHINVTDIDSMDSKWRKEFEQEVAEGSFVRGGKSFVLVGEGATLAHEQWAACLSLINMPVYFMTANELKKRVKGELVLRDTEDVRAAFEEAEAWFIADFFKGEWSPEDSEILFWTLTEAINDGVVIVIATDSEKAATGLYQYEPIVDLCEQAFEAINGAQTKTRAKKRN